MLNVRVGLEADRGGVEKGSGRRMAGRHTGTKEH